MTDPDFWSKEAPGYAKKKVPDEAAYRQTLDRTRGHLSATDHVLEIGCGTGTTALLLAPDCAHITATDYAEGMIRIAREKAAAEGANNVRFEVATPETAPPREGGYDAVLAFNFLHLVPDVQGTLDAVHRHLKPGGLFISKSGCVKEMNIGLRLILPLLKWIGKAPYVNVFTRDDLRADVERAGFEIIDAGGIPDEASTNYFIVARRR